MDFTGKVALVTGSGRGIGKAIAMKLAQNGATLVINDVGDSAPAEQTATEIKNLNRQATVVMADVSSSPEVTHMVDTAIATYGKIDILVNNAGITRDQLTMKMSDEEWDKVLAIDLKSVFLCTRAVLRPMLKQRSGRIISMSSVVGIIGNAGQANYAAAKAGIIGFTKTIAKEVASRGITVNAVAPGFINTPMTQVLAPERKQALLANIPLGSLGTPQDIAETVAFLASEEARYITGQVITVDGGISLGKL
jgi:3-oxoacyl-[acyl-carrier protein] reductase